MTAPSIEHNELRGLIASMREDALAPGQAARLNDILDSSPAARELFAKYSLLQATIELAWSDKPIALAEDEGPEIAESTFAAPFPSLPTTHYSLPATFVGGPVFSYMVATVVLCFMLLGAWAYKITHDRNVVATNSRRSTTSGPSDRLFVGRITGMKDCRWSDPDTQTIVGASVSLDREYALAKGLLEITYKTGAKVIIEGPCKYKVESSAGGFLAIGKLTAKISDQRSAVSGQQSEHYPLSTTHYPLFSVRTPTAVVTDLGTEFGVEVEADGTSNVMVFQGSVAVKSTDSTGELKILDANESLSIKRNADGVAHLVKLDDAPRFVRRMPRIDPRAYAKTVLSDGPLFYWTFDEPAGPAFEQVHNSPFQTLYPHGGAKRRRHEEIDSSLVLGRAADFSGAAGAFASRRMERKTLVGPWAIEFWIQATGGDRVEHNGQYILNVGLYGNNSYFARNNPAVIFNWPVNALENELQLFSHNRPGTRQTHGGPVLNDERWRHVVLVFYRNASAGRPPRVDVVLDGVRRTIDDGGFSAGFYLPGQVWVGGAGPDLSHPFQGRIDELAFYNFKDMTIDQIEARVADIGRRHFEAARNVRKGGAP